MTIGFGGLKAGAFTGYQHGEFGVKPHGPASWSGEDFGDPAPSIEFMTPGGVKSTGSIVVTRGGKTFVFQSVAVYSSITMIPYKFRGSLKGLTKYVAMGTQPNTFGNFATVANPNATVPIDKLEISITNPVTIGENPEGIDNIVLEPLASK